MKKNLKGAVGFAAFLIILSTAMVLLPTLAGLGIICPWVPVTVAAVLGIVIFSVMCGLMIHDIYQGHDDD